MSLNIHKCTAIISFPYFRDPPLFIIRRQCVFGDPVYVFSGKGAVMVRSRTEHY